MPPESKFQKSLIDKIIRLFGHRCEVVKNDAKYRPGYPDLSVHFFDGRYALLECKADRYAKEQPNQRFYIEQVNRHGGFGRFVFPENAEEVLNELQRAFPSYR